MLYYTLFPLSIQVYKWEPGSLMLGVTLRCTGIISCEVTGNTKHLLKVYMTDFFFARLNLPNVLISVAKQLFR